MPGGLRGRWSLGVGSLFGVPIRIHATFVLLVVWFGAVSASQGGTYSGGVVFILLLFGCVVLHELGHALMARRLGIRTLEIVLHPIGGVARLEGVPTGLAELLIAMAGPAVNLALAVLLVALVGTSGVPLPSSPREMLAPGELLLQLALANGVLFAFNLLPAFPMDGGRILRALMSLAMPEEKATSVAAMVGQGLALVLLTVGALKGQPLLLVIALFVLLGATQEATAYRRRAMVRGRTAREAMVTRFETLAPQDSLERAMELLLSTPQKDFPVLDAWDRPAGVLTRGGLLEGLTRCGRNCAVLEVMARKVPSVGPEVGLDEVLAILQGHPSMPVLVTGNAGLEGMISLESLGELVEVASRLAQREAKRRS